ncbi:hypothetical protein BGX30_004115 [Mortierella sp. GBA39]|nr:hypothetical protein BGX30_004115 [Mortierella sp. GBA39]
MATITHSSSEARPSNYHPHFKNKSRSSLSQARPTTTAAATRAPAARILKCGICFEDFEWFSLKDLPDFQGDTEDYNFITTDALPLLPRIAEKPILILSGHAHGRTGCSRQRRMRFTGALFGGRHVLREEQEALAAASDVNALLEPEKPVSLKLGSSLHLEKDHAFCMECSVRYIDTQVKAHAWPVVCPKEKCGEMVSGFAVEALLGDDAVKWHALGLEYAVKNKIYCPSLTCGMLIDGELYDGTEPVDHHCPYCKKPFCAMCLAPAHKGNNCDKRQDKIFENLANASNWKNCPTCRQKIEKTSVDIT